MWIVARGRSGKMSIQPNPHEPLLAILKSKQTNTKEKKSTHPDVDLGSTSGHDSLLLQNCNAGLSTGVGRGERLCLKDPLLTGGANASKEFLADCRLDDGKPVVGSAIVPGVGTTFGKPAKKFIKISKK